MPFRASHQVEPLKPPTPFFASCPHPGHALFPLSSSLSCGSCVHLPSPIALAFGGPISSQLAQQTSADLAATRPGPPAQPKNFWQHSPQKPPSRPRPEPDLGRYLLLQELSFSPQLVVCIVSSIACRASKLLWIAQSQSEHIACHHLPPPQIKRHASKPPDSGSPGSNDLVGV